MKLELRNVLLQLSEFALEVDTSIASARTAIFGPSGAGKTSLLEIIAGLRECTLRPDLLQWDDFRGFVRFVARPPAQDRLPAAG